MAYSETENINSYEDSDQSKSKLPNKDEWQYSDLYPERRGAKLTRNWFRTIIGLEGKEELSRMKCERNVYWCLRNSPLVKVLVGALKSSGCDFDIRRHISCEVCDTKISGGFDAELNQVVVCQNVATRKSIVQGVLTHEMIHMFDYCRNDIDFKNLHHLACTEIRAANLAHCSFMSALTYGSTSPFNFKNTHRECVRQKALTSVMALKGVTKEQGLKAIDEVFPKCYADLEPIGRRCRRNSMDPEFAFLEAPLYGYDYKL